MIDVDKLPEAERDALEEDAATIRRYFDEAMLLSDELHLNVATLPIVALMLCMIRK
jgi:hypothetical protein